MRCRPFRQAPAAEIRTARAVNPGAAHAASNVEQPGPQAARRAPPESVPRVGKIHRRERSMQHACSYPAGNALRRLILGVAFAAGIAAAALAHMQSVRAADLPPTPAAPGTASNAAPPPVASPAAPRPPAADAPKDTDAADEDADEPADAAAPQSGASKSVTIDRHGIFIEKGNKRVRIEGLGRDREYDSFEQFVQDAPWLAGLVFLTVLMVFLIPLLIIVLLIWYKLRKNRLANETMLKLAERGIVPPTSAMDAVASGNAVAAAAAAAETPPPNMPAYERARFLHRRTVWSDLRKGVILTAIGLGLVFFSILDDGTPNSVGLVFLFVGLGYCLLWFFEDRTTTRPPGTPGVPPPTGGA